MELGKRIQALRKEKGLTQNELADKLFVSYQAVSQWENGNTNPDISLLPEIAKVFDVTIDELFFEKSEEKVKIDINNYDKDTLYIVLVKGDKLLNVIDYNKVICENDVVKIDYTGNVLNVKSHFSITVNGDVLKDCVAGDSVSCGKVGGTVTAGDSVTCGPVEGDVTAGDEVASGPIKGNVTAGDSVACGHVGGNVTAGDSVACGNIEGDVSACDSIKCERINGNVNADTRVEAVEISGEINAEEVVCENIVNSKINCEVLKVKNKIQENI